MSDAGRCDAMARPSSPAVVQRTLPPRGKGRWEAGWVPSLQRHNVTDPRSRCEVPPYETGDLVKTLRKKDARTEIGPDVPLSCAMRQVASSTLGLTCEVPVGTSAWTPAPAPA